MIETRTALVLGATGGIGGEMVRTLLARGWAVKALHRDPAGRPGMDWIKGDAMNAADVAAAAVGADVIVHAVNPPGYRNWGALVLPMLDNSIAAARACGARLVLPGTVYNFGPDAFPAPGETAPQNPRTRKGAIRAAMERRLHDAAQDGVKVLIVRAGDFFGPRSGNNWFSQGLVKPGRPLTKITYPGARGVGHQWAYLPDVAETMARLLEQPLEDFAVFHMDGHWDADGTQMIAAIHRAAGAQLPVAAMPWGLMRLLSPVVPLFREIGEMRYLWQAPLRMDNAKLRRMLGSEPHTPLDVAVRETLAGQGCLGAPEMASPATQIG